MTIYGRGWIWALRANHLLDRSERDLQCLLDRPLPAPLLVELQDGNHLFSGQHSSSPELVAVAGLVQLEDLVAIGLGPRVGEIAHGREPADLARLVRKS